MEFLPESWLKVVALQTPFFELVVRAVLLYFGILMLMRIMPRRSGGELEFMDLIFALLIANEAANSLGSYIFLSDGFVFILTMMGCNYLLNALSYRSPFVAKLTAAPPLQIIRNGQAIQRNSRRELLTKEELVSSLRQRGIDDIKQVKSAFVEAEGKITVSRQDGKRVWNQLLSYKQKDLHFKLYKTEYCHACNCLLVGG